ncbi:hypothetical protein BJY04DRAFT_8034 [Aspergillus karnatakaensis]|uniref:uncharacterized protein n=1 Tax=Aspergillus karnatakaensis TaxID=1810916 RepID=UPI003CCDF3B1
MSKPIALILGVGPRVGTSIAATFANKGYHVAVASRKGTGDKTPEGYLSLAADFSNPNSVPTLFDSVQKSFGAAPAVVVYNAASLTPPPEQDSALSIPSDRLAGDLNVNTVSPYVAAQKAVEGWSTLPGDVKKTFIFTGNILNVRPIPLPLFLTLGVGKSATSYWIGTADQTYKARGYRFFYADQRTAGGDSVGNDVDGPAHADFYAKLAAHEGDVPWLATFVPGQGYTKFD